MSQMKTITATLEIEVDDNLVVGDKTFKAMEDALWERLNKDYYWEFLYNVRIKDIKNNLERTL